MFFGSYAANIITGIAFVLIGPLVGALMNNPRVMLIGFGLGTTILLWIVVFAIWRKLGTPEASREGFPPAPQENVGRIEPSVLEQNKSIAGVTAGDNAIIANQITQHYHQQPNARSSADDRAYIELENSALKDFAVGSKPRLTIQVSNKGDTKAISVRGTCSLIISSHPLTEPPNIPDPEYEVGQIVPSGKAVEIETEGKLEPITPNIFNQVSQGKGFIYAFAIVKYKDVSNKAHTYRLGMIYNPETRRFKFLDFHNGEDDGSKESLETSPAYITLSNPVLEDFEPGKNCFVRIDLKNTGKTPARFFKASYLIVLSESKLEGFDPNLLPNSDAPGVPLAPNESTTITLDANIPDPLTHEQFERITSGKLFCYVFGRITYTDLLKKPHFRNFGWLLSLRKKVFEDTTFWNEAE